MDNSGNEFKNDEVDAFIKMIHEMQDELKAIHLLLKARKDTDQKLDMSYPLGMTANLEDEENRILS